MNALFARGIKDLLTEKSYAAALAELNYNISSSTYGIELVCAGYDDKLSVLLQMVMDKISNFSITEERFAVLKDTQLRKLKNWAEEQPYTHASFYMTHLLRERNWSPEQLIEVMEGNLSALIYIYVLL